MNLHNVTALVSGDYLGLGKSFAAVLAARGAKVYFGVPGSENPKPGLTPSVHLDVSSADAVSESRRLAGDVNLLINITGAPTGATLITGAMQAIRQDMESLYFGPLRLVQAFAPVIERNGGGVVCNVLPLPPASLTQPNGSLMAARAAAWTWTDDLRGELAQSGIRVSALHVGRLTPHDAADSAETAPNSDAAVIRVLEAVLRGEPEILVELAVGG